MTKPKRVTSKPLDKVDAAVAEVLALAKKNDPRVLAYFQALVDGNTSFSVFDFECYPEMLLRGRKGEAWKGSVVELAGADQLDDADDAHLARLRFAISMAGDESLDDDVRERLAELED